MISSDIFIFERGKAHIADDGMDIPEVKAFYDSDKKNGKPKFNAYMKALYYMYSKGSPYFNMSYEERIDRIEAHHIGNRKWTNMISDPLFKSVVDIYILITTSKEERQFKKQMSIVQEDIDLLIEKLQRIPTVRRETVWIDVKNDSGATEKREVHIEMINTDERNRAIKALQQAYELQDYVKDKIKSYEVSVTTKKGYTPLFDDPNN